MLRMQSSDGQITHDRETIRRTFHLVVYGFHRDAIPRRIPARSHVEKCGLPNIIDVVSADNTSWSTFIHRTASAMSPCTHEISAVENRMGCRERSTVRMAISACK
jgi:hypothetical protein